MTIVRRVETVNERIDITTLTFPGHLWTPFMPPVDQGAPAMVNALLTLPPADAPIPAVVLTHGCGGLRPGITRWAGELQRMGMATLVVNSFAERGVAGICTGGGRINLASLLTDMYRALDLLGADPRIDSERVAIMGFSFGGRNAVWTAHTRFRDRYGTGSEFAAHLAFYPVNCYIELTDELELTGAPIRIFHGAADDWTPIDQCHDYVDRLRRAGIDADIHEYADAHHGFDEPTLGAEQSLLSAVSPRGCRFVEQEGTIIDPDTGNEAGVGSPCVEAGVTTGYDADAHAASILDVESFLTELFGLR